MSRKSTSSNVLLFSGGMRHGQDNLQPYDDEAIDYYDSIRNMSPAQYQNFVQQISYNTNFSYQDIDNMVQHLCINKYNLFDGRYDTLDEDPMIMFSLQRLHHNTYYDCDIVLIQHEIMEYSLIQQGYTQDDAHCETSQSYSYAEALAEALDEGFNLFTS